MCRTPVASLAWGPDGGVEDIGIFKIRKPSPAQGLSSQSSQQSILFEDKEAPRVSQENRFPVPHG